MSRRTSVSSTASVAGQPSSATLPNISRSSTSYSRKTKAKPLAASRSRSSTYVNDHLDNSNRPNARRASASYSAKPVLSIGTTTPKFEPWSPPLSPMLEQHHIIKAYASLPSSPRLSSATLAVIPVTPVKVDTPPFSLWEYLREELLATDFDSHQELKWERVSNFLSIPIGVEKVRDCELWIHTSWP